MKSNPWQEFTIWNRLFFPANAWGFSIRDGGNEISVYWLGLYFYIPLSLVSPNKALAVIPAPLFSAVLQAAND